MWRGSRKNHPALSLPIKQPGVRRITSNASVETRHHCANVINAQGIFENPSRRGIRGNPRVYWQRDTQAGGGGRIRKRSEVGAVVREQAEDHAKPVPSRQVMEAVARDRTANHRHSQRRQSALGNPRGHRYKPKQTSAVLELNGTQRSRSRGPRRSSPRIPGSSRAARSGTRAHVLGRARAEHAAGEMNPGMRALSKKYAENGAGAGRLRKTRRRLRQAVGEGRANDDARVPGTEEWLGTREEKTRGGLVYPFVYLSLMAHLM